MAKSKSSMRIPIQYVPISGINPLFEYDSPPRQVMLGGNLTQVYSVEGRTRKRLRSGLERKHAQATFKHQFREDSTVLAVIPRYTAKDLVGRNAESPTSLVIYEEYETGMLNCLQLDRNHVMHQHYGFEYSFDPKVMDKLRQPNAMMRAGTVVAHSPNVTPDGDYMIGLEANVAFTSGESGAEDGIKFSRSFAERIAAPGCETRSLSFGRTHYPGNWNGTPDNFKIIPDIGETIRNNGMIGFMRPFDPTNDALYMTARSLMKPIYDMDVPIFGKAGAKVVDVKVYHNPKAAGPDLPEEMTGQLRRYMEADKEYCRKIIRTVMDRRGKRDSNGKVILDHNLKIHPDLWTVLYDAIVYAGMDLITKDNWPEMYREVLGMQRTYRGGQLDKWRVDITFTYKAEIAEGPKLTSLHGVKGTAVYIAEDEDMLVDKFGNRAEVEMSGTSTVGRMVQGQMGEPIIGAAGRDVIKRVRRKLGMDDMGVYTLREIQDIMDKTPTDTLMELFDYVLGFYEIISPLDDYRRALKYKDEGDRWMRHLMHVIEDGNEPYGMYVHYVPGRGRPLREVYPMLKASGDKYMPEVSECRYRWTGDKEFTWTESPIMIAPTYFLPLEKTATDWSGVGSAKLGHFGTAARLTQQDRYTRPGRETSTKTTGEDETRNLSKSFGGEVMKEIFDIHADPAVHRAVCRGILDAEFPTNIDEVITDEDRAKARHRPKAHANHMIRCSGKGFERK